MKRFHAADISYFYPRSPCGERQAANGLAHAPPEISIHALLAESDTESVSIDQLAHNFYPRSPCGERHGDLRRADMIQRISIHALLAESDQTVTKWASSAKISIHALLAESDKSSWSLTRLNRNISIHALLAESDGLGFCYHCDDVAFLSTLSLRRATAPNRRPCRCNKISIHALLAESDLFFIVFDLFRNISIHALLAESDSPLSINCMIHMQFLSTLSLRRATPWHGVVITSLHHFYPRSPCGERRFGPGVGGAQQRISIHALLAESDPWYISLEDWQTSLFLSTLSLRRATG